MQCIPIQPKHVQAESNDESKSRKSIMTTNFITYKKSHAL